jgi:hypothetical protein
VGGGYLRMNDVYDKGRFLQRWRPAMTAVQAGINHKFYSYVPDVFF